MSLSIVTNVTSLVARENLRLNTDFQARTIERVTSGLRINMSGDDAAGLAIANSFRGNIAELNQGVRNANDGLSSLQIIDGGLNNISKILDRLRTLATQASSDTFSGSLATLDTEFQSLVAEINRQADNIHLGVNSSTSSTSLSVYVGGGATQTQAKVTINLTSSQVDASTLTVSSLSLTSATSALAALSAVAAAVGKLGTVQGKVGTGENTLQYSIQLAQSQIASYSSAESRIRDADIATEAANLTQAQVTIQASMAALAQANSAPQAVLTLLRG